MKRIILFYTIYLSIALGTSSAQDAVFTQFYSTPLQINPAFAGSTFAPRFAINYRDQWHNVPNAYGTFAMSYDQYVDALNSGFGVNLMNDRSGDGVYQKNTAGVTYAYRLRTNSGVNFKIGIEAGIGQTSIDWNRFVFLDMLDPINGNTGTISSKEIAPQSFSKSYFDVSTGLLVYNNKWYGGLALKHLNTPNQSFLDNKTTLNSGLPILMSLHGGYEIALKENFNKKVVSFITPNFLFVKQGPFYQLNLGAQAGLGSIFGGLGFRHTIRNADAILVNVGVKKGVFKINYSHDITLNGLSNTFGGHEVSIMLNFDELYDRKKPNYLDCFNFMR